MELAPLESRQQARCDILDESHVHVGIPATEDGEKLRDEAFHELGRCPDPQDPGLPAAERLSPLEQRLDVDQESPSRASTSVPAVVS
jgi:hypothetical protein